MIRCVARNKQMIRAMARVGIDGGFWTAETQHTCSIGDSGPTKGIREYDRLGELKNKD